jgi:hypothetical protein
MAVINRSVGVGSVIAVAVLLSGCASASTSSGTARDGTLTGRALNYGGPLLPNGSMAANGVPAGGMKVAVASKGRQVATATTGPDGTFTFILPAGAYVLSGCEKANVSVTAGGHTVHDITCAVP